MSSNTDDFDLPDSPKPRKPKVPPRNSSLPICPFTVVIDTREQLPYSFDGLGFIVPKCSKGLQSGDYSIQGCTSQIAIERKSLKDLYGSCTWGRERFEREIGRLDAFPGFAAVVIEASWIEIADPTLQDPAWDIRATPESIIGTITAWSIRYPRVHWWAIGSRRECEKQIFRTFRKWWDENSAIGPSTR